MAINFVLEERSLTVKYQIGQDSQGNPLFASEKLDKIKPSATDEQMLALGNAIGAVLFTGGGRSHIKDKYQVVTTAE
ncbi:MAG: DUF1659 domain-containing protein [Sarcina sp.]